MVKKFTIPFASQGDANDIPDALQVDGKVSFTQGFGYDYERPYDDPQAKDIAREDMNGLFKAITTAVGELQTLGASEWSSAVSYPKGAIVYYEKDLYISQVDDNQNKPPQNWVSITSIANDSLKKAANLSDLTNKATARNNLGLGSSATLNKTDVLGTSTSLVATQKLVNDTKINLDNSVGAVDIKSDKAQSTANTAVTKADNAQSRADDAYNLADSKWSPQATTGTGNIARMSEVEKKVDKTTLSGTGFDKNKAVAATKEVGKYNAIYATTEGFDYPPGAYDYGALLNMYHGYSGDNAQIYIEHADTKNLYFRPVVGAEEWKRVLTNNDVSQSAGSSTTNVMSQKAVTDRLNSIESGHGLGYEQSWVDVTSQRAKETTYKNNTGKPIFIYVSILDTGSGSNVTAYFNVSGIDLVSRGGGQGSAGSFKPTNIALVIPNNAEYKLTTVGNVSQWVELR